jgi:hypothetical protein
MLLSVGTENVYWFGRRYAFGFKPARISAPVNVKIGIEISPKSMASGLAALGLGG